MGQCPLTGAGAANCGGATAGSCPRGSLPIGVAPNTEDSARMTGLANSVLTGSLMPFSGPVNAPFSVPCGAVEGGQLGELCPRCSSVPATPATATQIIAWLRPSRSLLPWPAPLAHAVPRSLHSSHLVAQPLAILLEFAILRTAYCGLSTTIAPGSRCRVFGQVLGMLKIGDAPITRPPCLVPLLRETFDKQKQKTLVAASRKCTSRPTYHQPTPPLTITRANRPRNTPAFWGSAPTSGGSRLR